MILRVKIRIDRAAYQGSVTYLLQDGKRVAFGVRFFPSLFGGEKALQDACDVYSSEASIDAWEPRDNYNNTGN